MFRGCYYAEDKIVVGRRRFKSWRFIHDHERFDTGYIHSSHGVLDVGYVVVLGGRAGKDLVLECGVPGVTVYVHVDSYCGCGYSDLLGNGYCRRGRSFRGIFAVGVEAYGYFGDALVFYCGNKGVDVRVGKGVVVYEFGRDDCV